MECKRFFLTIFLFGIWTKRRKASKPAYSTALETSLRKELFNTNEYEVLQRPDRRVKVKICLTILSVNDLNIKTQALSISGYLTVKWQDPRLDWSNSSATSQDYTNVPFLYSTEQHVWRPAIVIENSVHDIGIISDRTMPLRIRYDGSVTWSPSGIYDVSCESDITYYPLDTQECKIKVSSWAYTFGDVKLFFSNKPVELKFYTENGEWILVSATGSKSVSRSRGTSSFSSLNFKVILQRRAMFHIINTLFPVALMAVLIAMVFKLPVDSGEKIGFSLTVLLAYAVYLTMISDNIPSTSVTVCYLSVYLVFILTLGAVSVVLTIFVLSLHFKSPDEEIPEWVKTMTYHCLLRIACMRKRRICSRKNRVENIQLSKKTGITQVDMATQGDPPTVKNMFDTGDNLTWQKLAMIMDNVFFNIYIGLIVIVTLTLFMLVFVHHYTS